MSEESGAIKEILAPDKLTVKAPIVTDSQNDGFDWAAFFTVVIDLLAATSLFFVIFAGAILTDAGLEWLQTMAGVHEDQYLVLARKGFKYLLIGVDCLVVLAFVLRGLAKTWNYLRRG